MADAVVSFVVERLGDYLIQEVNFLGGVKGEVESLTRELQWMQCFIKDAESKQAGNDLISRWVSDIRDIAYDAEDVLDKYMLNGSHRNKRGLVYSIRKCSCIISGELNLLRQHNLGNDIENLKKRLADVDRRRQSYSLQNRASDRSNGEKHNQQLLKNLRRVTSYDVGEDSVGFEDDTQTLLSKIFNNERRRLVISIHGMGGSGKTTLAKKLYHTSEVKKKFRCCAWVSVSQDYKVEDLLLGIIKSFNIIQRVEDLQNKSEEDLERCLHNSLQGKSYMMVVDDVWNKGDWQSLRRAFPDGRNGSRVIITTRNREVAEHSDENTYAHKLRSLTEDESWSLFLKKAFRSIAREKELEKIGREMVKKCDGLPLAVAVLGGLLSTKRPQEWYVVHDRIWRHLRDNSVHISHYLLDLSFNDLSHQLKLCFLYLSLYPEDFEINVERLIRLFVAEGFIEQDKDQSLEEVAKDNFDHLVNRNLVQVEKRRRGRISTCRVHDLLRDLAIKKAEELDFLHICDEIKNPNPSSVISSSRRQAVYSSTSSYLWLHHSNPHSRSLMLFQKTWFPLQSLINRFSLARVFDVEESSPSRLPKEIGKLIHLKYLRCEIYHRSLPSSFVNLQRLQTLDFTSDTSSSLVNLPIEINMMNELRHLIGIFIGTLPIENLTNLQTLKYVKGTSWKKVNTAKLINLRELRIKNYDESEAVFTFESIANLKNLRFFSVEDVRQGHLSSYHFSSLQPLSYCQRLVDLSLRVPVMMDRLPDGMHVHLPNLECLTLFALLDEENPMAALEMMPHLTMLHLKLCMEERASPSPEYKLRCRAEGFRLLEILHLEGDTIVELEVEEGAMPLLRACEVSNKITIPDILRALPPPADSEYSKEIA